MLLLRAEALLLHKRLSGICHRQLLAGAGVILQLLQVGFKLLKQQLVLLLDACSKKLPSPGMQRVLPAASTWADTTCCRLYFGIAVGRNMQGMLLHTMRGTG